MTLAQQIAAKIDAAKAIQSLAAKENRDLSADELATVKANLDDADALKAQEAEERAHEQDQASTLARLSAADADLSKPRPRRVGGDTSKPVAVAPAVAREAFLDDPKRGFKSVRNLLSDLRQSAVRGSLSPQLKSLLPSAEYLAGGEMQATAGSDEHSTFDYGSLGVMVPNALLPGVMTMPAPDDPFPDTLKVPLVGGAVEILARTDKNHSSSVSGGLRVYRRAESQAGTASRTSVEKITLRADPLMGVTYDTEELLADAPGVAMALIEAGFQDEFKAKRVQEIISGTGAGENLGFSASPCVIDVAKETGQATASLTFDNVIKMLARSWKGNRWVANPTCIPQLAKMNAGTNGLVWQPSAREGIPATLLGMPIVFTEFCSAVGTVGDIVLVNMSQYIETIRQDVKTEESIHVRFLDNERAFRFTARRGGAPWWRSAFTPKNGDALSPFVRLATRS